MINNQKVYRNYDECDLLHNMITYSIDKTDDTYLSRTDKENLISIIDYSLCNAPKELDDFISNLLADTHQKLADFFDELEK